MACFVEGDGTLFRGGHHLRLLLQSADDTVNGIKEVLFLHRLLVVAGGNQRSLVTYVGNVGTRESWRLAGQLLDVEALVNLDGLEVNLEDGLALVKVGKVDIYLTVEASGTHQRRVEHVGTVGGSKDNHAAVGAEAVHLGQQGIQRVLALVVSAHSRVLRAGTSHSVNFVDEDDTWRLLLSLAEQVAHTTGTHAHEHLNEVASRHREEGHAGFSGHGLGQQRLTCSRRTNEQRSLGNLSAQFGVFLRVLQEFHNLLHFLLGTLLSGHVLERDVQVAAFLIHLGFRLAHIEDAASGTS